MQGVCEGLQIVGQVIRFVDVALPKTVSAATAAGGGQNGSGNNGGGSSPQAHLAQDLVNAVWPLLEQTAQLAGSISRQQQQGGGKSDVCTSLLDQLFALYRHLIVGLRLLVARRLPGLLSTVVQLFGDTAHEGALETVGQVVEMFNEGVLPGVAEEAEAAATFAQLFSAMCERTFAYIRNGHPPQECPNMITSFFDMTLRYLAFRPSGTYVYR